MDEVLSGYFADAHKGLTKQRPAPNPRGFVSSGSHVKLPTLPGSGGGYGSPPMSGGSGGGDWGGGGSGGLRHSSSTGALDSQRGFAAVQGERYQQMLTENDKQARRIRQLQETLSITSARKEAFKVQAQKLEKEFKKIRETCEQTQQELLESRRDVEQYSKEAADAVSMMSEMRKAHIHEVRLLQRGLAARGGGEQFRNRVDEVADLVDKLGRAVVQRDESIRDKTKMQAQVNKVMADHKSVSGSHEKLRKKNEQLETKLTDAMRKVKMVERRRPQDPVDPDDSDEEFEAELLAFEKHFEILQDNSTGADVLADSLCKDKTRLEQKLKQMRENQKSLEGTVEYWMQTCGDKDLELQENQAQLDKMLKADGDLQSAIEKKTTEVGDMVEDERQELQRKLAEAERERDEAWAETKQTSEKMSAALVQVSKEYEGHAEKKKARDALTKSGQEEEAPAVDSPTEESKAPEEPAKEEPAEEAKQDPPKEEAKVLKKEEQQVKTGELLELTLFGSGDAVELAARELPDGQECRIPISDELIRELDEEDPWSALFGRVGISAGPPRRAVVSSSVGNGELTLGGSDVILEIYRYDSRRFLFEGMDLATSAPRDLLVMDDAIPADLQAQLDATASDAALFTLLASRLSLEGEDLVFT